MRLLLNELGMDPNGCAAKGQTALMQAAAKGKPEAILVLQVSHGLQLQSLWTIPTAAVS